MKKPIIIIGGLVLLVLVGFLVSSVVSVASSVKKGTDAIDKWGDFELSAEIIDDEIGLPAGTVADAASSSVKGAIIGAVSPLSGLAYSAYNAGSSIVDYFTGDE